MTFGLPPEFAIEAYHEPSGRNWAGFGRMAVHIQGVRIGDIRENHCSLFHAADRFREVSRIVETLWDESFSGLSDAEIFAVVDDALYIGCNANWERYGTFDFLTNTGEQFDGFKTFIVCRPGQRVHILYQLPDNSFGSASCPIQAFRNASESFVEWFDEEVRTIAPPYFPIEPFRYP